MHLNKLIDVVLLSGSVADRNWPVVSYVIVVVRGDVELLTHLATEVALNRLPE